jgi:chemotaxis protein MotB
MRRNGGQVSGSIWPGFVDAMTALLLILMFVLTIFMVVQFVLRETITGQDEELNSLSVQIAGLAEALGLEQTRAQGLEGELGTSQGNLQSAESLIAQQTALIGSLTSETESQKARIASFENQVAGLLGERNDLTTRLTDTQVSLSELKDAQTKTLSEKEAVQLALAQARDEIDLQTEQARLAAAKREAFEALIADLNRNASARDTELSAKIAELSVQDAELSAKDATLKGIVAELDRTTSALTEVEKQRLVELAASEALRERLKNSQDELTAMTLALDAKRKDAENTLTLLAAAEAAKTAATELAGKRLTEQEKESALLAHANSLLNNEKAVSADGQRKLALLNQQTNALRTQLNALQGLLDDAKENDAKAQIQIESLGSNLNTALARVAAEQKQRAALEENERIRLEEEAEELKKEATDLKKFKSEFFGKLRDVLGGQEGIRIVGDRFVFSSEILYTAGSAELGVRGKEEIRKVADVIQDVASQIPSEIDWILRVDGHTDKIPLSGFGTYRDNWELSQARALSVVKYLINDLDIPANRLAANGFGEFQPIIDGDSPEALAINRRIELKFTEK